MPPLTTVMARDLGLKRRQLGSPHFVRLLRGVYLPADEPITITTWVNAARLVLPDDARPDGLTALQLAGLDLGSPLPLQFATATTWHTARPEIRLRRTSRAQSPTCLLDGLIEHCRQASLLDAVTVGDRAVQLRLLSVDQVGDLSDHVCAQVRAAGRLIRAGAESVQETRLRLCIVLAGLPEPELQVKIHDDRYLVGRFDMGFRDYRLLVEYEGDQHRTDSRQWDSDIVREENARRLGYGYVRVTAQLMRNPWRQVLRIHEGLVAGGYRGAAPKRTPVWLDVFGRSGQRR